VNPRFLTLTEVTAIHASRLALYGGLPGVRDPGGLESAVAMPQAGFGGAYLHEDLFAMAAAYLYHLAAGHPFVDGNKRTGVAAADMFLTLNGYDIPATAEDAFEALVWEVARGTADKARVAEFLRETAVPVHE